MEKVQTITQKVDLAFKKINFQIKDDEKDQFIRFLYVNHLKLHHLEYEIYPKYFKFLYKTILNDL